MTSFAKELFRGRLRVDLLDPPPPARLGDDATAFLARLRSFCEKEVDGERIEREDRVPDDVIAGLAGLGAFAIKLPAEYGGLGLSGVCYHRALMLASTAHPALSELLAAHQAIGLPQPVTLFGTEEQRRRLLPRCVREISAFALTEPDIGNDPYRMHTTAVPSEDKETYTLNGVKLWCTNGVLADLVVVLAVVPDAGMTAFVVEAAAEGFTVEHRSSFLGLRGVENGVLRLRDVVVPARDRIGGEGEGLDVALAAQDTGRLSLPAVCAAATKWSLRIAREWSRARVQFGRPIGEHEAVAAKVAFIAATAFALEAVVEVTGRHADAGLVDTRVEAELAKLYASERAWTVADELVQLRGGRGYETAASAAARGERGVPAEQALRDLRIGRIFDGSSEALRLFLADAVLGEDAAEPGDAPDGHLGFVATAARRLAESVARGRERWPEIMERQLFLGRVVDIGAELYAMSASLVYAKDLGGTATELADVFCHQARGRVEALFDCLWRNTDDHDRTLARHVLDDRYTWLEDGVVDPSTGGPWIAEPPPGPNLRRVVH